MCLKSVKDDIGDLFGEDVESYRGGETDQVVEVEAMGRRYGIEADLEEGFTFERVGRCRRILQQINSE